MTGTFTCTWKCRYAPTLLEWGTVKWNLSEKLASVHTEHTTWAPLPLLRHCINISRTRGLHLTPCRYFCLQSQPLNFDFHKIQCFIFGMHSSWTSHVHMTSTLTTVWSWPWPLTSYDPTGPYCFTNISFYILRLFLLLP